MTVNKEDKSAQIMNLRLSSNEKRAIFKKISQNRKFFPQILKNDPIAYYREANFVSYRRHVLAGVMTGSS